MTRSLVTNVHNCPKIVAGRGMSAQTTETPQQSRTRPGTSAVVRNVFSNWGSYLIAIGVNFFISPYVVRHLGNTGYGVWTLILALTGYLGLLDLGIRGAVTRYVARFHAQNDHNKAANVASSAMLLFSAFGLLAVLSSFLLAAVAIHRMNIPPEYWMAARIVVILTGISVAISLVNGVFGGILVGLQRFDLTNSIETAMNVLRAGAVALALHWGFGIVALAFIQLGFTLARWLANVYLAHRLYPALRIQLGAADLAGVKLIFSYGAFSFLIHVSASLIYASDNVVIGAYLPVSAVTFYAIGGNLVEYARALVSGISQTMTPLASSMEVRTGETQMQRIVLFSSRAGTMVMLPVALTFILRGSSFVGLWMGAQYAELSGQVLRILSITLLLWAANAVTAGSLLGLSKHRPIVPATVIEGLCNLALSVFLVKRMGILGVAWGTVVPSVAAQLMFWPWYIRRTVGIHPVAYFKSAWLRPATAIIPFALGSYALERFWPAHNLAVFFLQVALALPLAVIGYWVVCLDHGQKANYSRNVASMVGASLLRRGSIAIPGDKTQNRE